MIDCLRKLNIYTLVTYIQVLSLWLLIATLPFRINIFIRWVMIVAGVLFVVEFVVNKRWRGWHWTRDKWLYVAMIALYLYTFIWHIGSHSENLILKNAVEERMAFVICGVIGLLGFSQYIRLRDVAIVFIVTSLVSSIFIIFHSGGFSFFLEPWMEQTRLFKESRIALLNSHMVYNLYLNTTLIMCFYLWEQRKLSPWNKILLGLACLWIVYLLRITEGRVGLFTMLILVSIFLLRWTVRYSWKIVIPILILCLGVGMFILSNNERISYEKVFLHDPRIEIWEAGWQTVKEAPILGQGVCDARETFVVKVHENDGLVRFWKPYVEKRNGEWNVIHPHSTFLEIWSEFGIVGLLTLLFLFVYPLTMRPEKHRIYIAMLVFAVGIQCLFDIFLFPILYCLVVIFFTIQKGAATNCATPIDNGDGL